MEQMIKGDSSHALGAIGMTGFSCHLEGAKRLRDLMKHIEIPLTPLARSE